jgi:hypothetical protein
MDLSHYAFDTLHSDGDLVLSRGRERTSATSHRRSILVKTTRSEQPRPETVRIMEHEFSLRAELDSTWAIRPRAQQYRGRTSSSSRIQEPSRSIDCWNTHGIGALRGVGASPLWQRNTRPHKVASRPTL